MQTGQPKSNCEKNAKIAKLRKMGEVASCNPPPPCPLPWLHRQALFGAFTTDGGRGAHMHGPHHSRIRWRHRLPPRKGRAQIYDILALSSTKTVARKLTGTHRRRAEPRGRAVLCGGSRMPVTQGGLGDSRIRQLQPLHNPRRGPSSPNATSRKRNERSSVRDGTAGAAGWSANEEDQQHPSTWTPCLHRTPSQFSGPFVSPLHNLWFPLFLWSLNARESHGSSLSLPASHHQP